MITYASNRAPLQYLKDRGGVMAVIIAVVGASYRSVGTIMAFGSDGLRFGSLSSGCIEDDMDVHAQKALETGKTVVLRYGQGSPFFDLKLPCGGGLTVLLVPNPDRIFLADILSKSDAREVAVFSIGLEDGAMALCAPAQRVVTDEKRTILKIDPELRFWVYGHGIEAMAFALMAEASGYEVMLFSQENLSSDLTRIGTLPVTIVPSFRSYTCPKPDKRTAIALFFHDHENEARILAQFLTHDSLFVGAQGSLRSRARLLTELVASGLTPTQMARLNPGFGLIPSCRDPRTLAVSVLAHVLSVAVLDQPQMEIAAQKWNSFPGIGLADTISPTATAPSPAVRANEPPNPSTSI